MAATSPYSNNDYQAVSNFRPYELPINDIFKAISAQNQFWDAGAARVKGVYDNALGLKLSKEGNQQIRDQYIKDAEKQLTKLSTMDLADASVQRKGFNLFKPLFKDEGVLYDDLATRHYDKVRQDALMYRGKDNGKQYSDINTQYAMQGYRDFLTSDDRMAGKTAYENRREYEPYYDYTEDFAKALKACPTSSLETQSPVYGKDNAITGYMKNSYIKSLTAGQAKGCLEANLSPKAARQLQIEGSVTYKNHPDVLASDTISYLSGVSSNLADQLQELHAKKAALQKNPQGLNAQELATLNKQLDLQAEALADEIDKTNHSVTKLSAGDYTDMLNNFDNYAGSVYAWKKIYRKALSSAFQEQRELYKTDPVQLNAIKFSQDKYLNQLDFIQAGSLEQMREEHEKEMKLLDLMYGNNGNGTGTGKGSDIFRNPLTGEIQINPNLMRETGNLRDKPEPDSKIYEKLTGEVTNLTNEDKANDLRLYNRMISRAERDKNFRATLLKGFNRGTTDDEWGKFKAETANNQFASGSDGTIVPFHKTTWFNSYTSLKPDDEDVNSWANDHMIINAGLNTLNRKLELGEAQVSKELGADYRTQINKVLSDPKYKSVTVNGVEITPQDIQAMIEGKNVKGLYEHQVKREYDVGNRGLVTKYEDAIGVMDSKGEIHYNGELAMMWKSIKNKNDDINSSLRKKRVEVFNKLGFDREPWYFTPDDKSSLVQTLKSLLPKVTMPNGQQKDADIAIIGSDFSGGVQISVPGIKKGHDTDNILTILRDNGVGTSAEATADGVVTIKGTTHNLIPQAINNPILQHAAYQLQTMGETTAFQQTQDGAKVQDTDIQIPIMVRGKMETMTVETYKNKNSPEFRVYVEGATDSRPIVIASNAYELFEKAARVGLDVNKPVR